MNARKIQWWFDKTVAVTILVGALVAIFLSFPVFGDNGYGRQYGYDANIDRMVGSIEEARAIIEGNGGVFVGIGEVARITNVHTSYVPIRFSRQQLLDCARCVLAYSPGAEGGVNMTMNHVPYAIGQRIHGRDPSEFARDTFASIPLKKGWYLLPLRAQQPPAGTAYSFGQWRQFSTGRGMGPMHAVVGAYVMALIPDAFAGQMFYTADRFDNGDVVVIGRASAGTFVLERRPINAGNRGIGYVLGMSQTIREGPSESSGQQRPEPAKGTRKDRLLEKQARPKK